MLFWNIGSYLIYTRASADRWC